MSGLPLILSRGDVYRTQFDPIRGHEQAGTRPAVIVSREEMTVGSTVLVVPFTSRRPDPAVVRDYVVAVPRRESCLPEDSWALVHQLRAVTKERLGDRLGGLEPRYLRLIDVALLYVLDLEAYTT